MSGGQIELHKIAETLSGMGYPDVNPILRLQPGRRVRLQPYGKPANNRGATFYLFPDGVGGYLCDYVNDIQEPVWPAETGYLSSEQLEQRRQQAHEAQLKAEAERQIIQDKVARQAQDRFRAGVSAGPHPYIIRKQLSGLYNARIDTAELMVPMWLSNVGLVNIQRISATGDKRFLKGGRVKDTYSVIGSLDGAKRVLVAEGWATAATLFELHGQPVVIAFSAGNLLSVCQTLRARFADLDIVIAADDDRQTKGNPGRSKSIESAEAINATLIFPELCRSCKCSDFNDSVICGRRRHD